MILLVDDDAPIRKLIRRTLETRGYRLLEARNGAEAVRVATQHHEPIHLLSGDRDERRLSELYLNATRLGLHESMRRYEQQRGIICKKFARKPDLGSKIQDETGWGDDANLLNWQGVRSGAGDGDRTRDQRLGKP